MGEKTQGSCPTIERIELSLSLAELLSRWPANQDLLVLGGQGSRFQIIALSFESTSLEAIAKQSFSEPTSLVHGFPKNLPFATGYIGLLSYDDFDPTDLALDPAGAEHQSSKIYRVTSSLVIDSQTRQSYLCSTEPDQARVLLKRIVECSEKSETETESWTWRAETSPESYVESVQKVLNDIRNGRYYQLNLLRYFKLIGTRRREDFITRWLSHSGPYGALLWTEGLKLISCSPERFVRIDWNWDRQAYRLQTQPIKGTAASSGDPIEDEKLKASLMQSPKDEAELNMIVDLLRNDMYKVSEKHSVAVDDPGSLHSFRHLHHRIATITSQLRKEVSFQSVCQALLPGGSITGAPKIEVMQAISEYEQRRRGYFMGSAFYWDQNLGSFDSSIMIRTCYRSEDRGWQFAAGSGLVIRSDPHLELSEIDTKCRVFIDNFE